MRYDIEFYVDYDGKTKIARIPRQKRFSKKGASNAGR